MKMQQGWTLGAGALVLALCGSPAMAADAATPAATPAAAAVFKAPNGIVVSPATIDLGRMMDAEARKIQFELTNTNTMAVKVLRIRAGCSCTNVTDFSAEPVLPGGKMAVTLEVLGDKLPKGEFKRTALVEFEGLVPATVPLKYVGAKNQPITIIPRSSVRLGKLTDPAATWTRRFEIIGDLDKGQVLTLGTPIFPALLKAELKAIKPSHYQLTVTQTGTRAWGAFKDRIQVPVTAPPGYAAISFSFSGQVGERLLAKPVMVWFPEATATKPVSAAVRRTFKVSQGAKPTRPVKAEELKVELPTGVKMVAVNQAGLRAVIELEFAPEFFSKERREKLLFSTAMGRAMAVAAVGGESPMSLQQAASEEIRSSYAVEEKAADDEPAEDGANGPGAAKSK
ncbi:MAG: DUF1573 domain-containing protein [Lentisphaeria bacterium]